MSDHRPLYYVTDDEADGIRRYAAGGWLVSPLAGAVRIYYPPGERLGLVDPTGRADCRSCGRRIHRDERAIRLGFLSTPPGGSVVAAYIHETCPEEER